MSPDSFNRNYPLQGNEFNLINENASGISQAAGNSLTSEQLNIINGEL